MSVFFCLFVPKLKGLKFSGLEVVYPGDVITKFGEDQFVR